MHIYSTATVDTSLSRARSSDMIVSLPPFPSSPNFIPSHYSFSSSSSSSLLAYSQLLESELDPMLESRGILPSEVSYSGSSGPCSSYESPTSQPSLMQRSASSLSFHQKGLSHGPLGFQLPASFDADGRVRRVYSSGDLQGKVERACSSESRLIIEGMTKVCRYSPEEKRERIERYKIKRTQRNFDKKIKRNGQYECRKTLADSRRRTRGRFAKNEEIENNNSTTSSSVETWNAMAEEHVQHDASWISFLDSYSINYVP